jgi:DHA1 family bicyclomycin/chloramphenicol resistance-like MFS transporter
MPVGLGSSSPSWALHWWRARSSWWLIPETLPPERRHPPHLGRVLGNYYGLLRHRLGMGYLLTGAFSFGGMMTFIVSSPYVYIVLYEVPTAWFGVLFGANVAVAMVTTLFNTRLVVRLGAERLLRLGLRVQVVAALILLGPGLCGFAAPLGDPAGGSPLPGDDRAGAG